jgi:hypothetical protein
LGCSSRRDVISRYVETVVTTESLPLHVNMARVYAPPNQIQTTSKLPRTHWAPTHGDDTQRHRLALMTRCSRSWGHGCLLELAWAFTTAAIIAFGSVDWMNTFSNFALCTRLGATGCAQRNFITSYPVLACVSPRVVRPRMTAKKLTSHPSLAFRFTAPQPRGILLW